MFNEVGVSGTLRMRASYPHFVDAKSNHIIISEHDNHRLQMFDCNGNESLFEPYGSKGSGPDNFCHPGGVTTTDHVNASIVAADTGNHRIGCYSVDTDYAGYGRLKRMYSFGQMLFREPVGIEYDSKHDQLAVADWSHKQVFIADLKTGQLIGEFRTPPDCAFVTPTDIALCQRSGLWYVTDRDAHCIKVHTKSGEFVGKFGSYGGATKRFNLPWGICFDQEENLIIADEGNNRVVMYRSFDFLRSAGKYSPEVVTKDVYRPKGISINTHSNLVVVDGNGYNFLKIFKYK